MLLVLKFGFDVFVKTSVKKQVSHIVGSRSRRLSMQSIVLNWLIRHPEP